jgi:hypothetical protein
MTTSSGSDAAEDDTVRGGPDPSVPAPPPTAVARLVGRLDGLERQPLTAQVDILDAVRRGLDEALARPVRNG